MSEPADVRIRILGRMDVVVAGREVRVQSLRARAALAFLAAKRGRVIMRTKLSSLLWTPREVKNDKHSLSQVIYCLRKALPEGTILRTGQALQLCQGCHVDVLELLDAARDKNYDRVLALYRGPALLDIDPTNAPEFERWRDSFSRKVDLTVLDGVRGLVGRPDAVLGYVDTVAVIRRGLEIDENDEDLICKLLECLSIQGHHRMALSEWEEARDRFVNDLGCPVPLRIRKLGESLENAKRVDVSRSRTAEPCRPPFTGRRLELARLHEFFDEVTDVGMRSIIIVGESGIGKSRLADQALRYCAIKGARIFAASGHQAERCLPMVGVIDGILSGARPSDLSKMDELWQREIVSIIPELSQEGAAVAPYSHEVDQRTLFEAVVRFYAAVAGEGPVVLFVDDLHWLDESSLAFLSYLRRRAQSVPLLLLATACSDNTPVGWLDQFDGAEYLTLAELSVQNSCEIVRWYEEAKNVSLANSLTEWIVDRAAGRPLFLLELLRYNLREPVPTGASGPMRSALSVPERLRELLCARLAGSWAAERLTQTLAVLGTEADFDTLRQVAGMGQQAAMAGLDELIQKQLVRSARGIVSFAHQLIGEVANSALTDVRSRYLHRRAAEVLSRTPGVRPGTLVRHLRAAGDAGNCWRMARKAAAEALRVRAYSECEYFLDVAGQVAKSSRQQSNTDAARVALYWQMDRYKDAVDTMQRMQDSGQVLRRISGLDSWFVEVKARLMDTDLRAPDIQDLIVERLDDIRWNPGNYRQAARTFMVAAEVAHDAGNVDVVLQIRNTLDQMVHALNGNREAVGELLALEARLEAVYLSASRAMGIARQADRLLQNSSDRGLRLQALTALGTSALLTGRLNTSRRAFKEAIAITADPAWFHWRTRVVNNYAVLLTETGEFFEARRTIAEGLQIGSPHDRMFLTGNLALLAIHEEDYDLGLRIAQELLDSNKKLGAKWVDTAACVIRALARQATNEKVDPGRLKSEFSDHYSAHGTLVPTYGRLVLALSLADQNQRVAGLRLLRQGIAGLSDRDALGTARLRICFAQILGKHRPSVSAKMLEEVMKWATRAGAKLIERDAQHAIDIVQGSTPHEALPSRFG